MNEQIKQINNLRAVCMGLLEAYAPQADATAKHSGENSLHSAVRNARQCLRETIAHKDTPAPHRILITVEGGVVQNVTADCGVAVYLCDLDNAQVGGSTVPERYGIDIVEPAALSALLQPPLQPDKNRAFLNAVSELLGSADDEGCTPDLTVVSRPALQAVAKLGKALIEGEE
jgi:hypothetical protein